MQYASADRPAQRHPPSTAALALVTCLLGSLALTAGHAAAGPAADYVAIPATAFASVISIEGDAKPRPIAAYAMRTTPVTNGEFLGFVGAHPEWRRDRVPSVFADSRYLSHWREAQRLAPDDWNYHRQAWSFTPDKAISNWLKKFGELKGKDYYPPLELPSAK